MGCFCDALANERERKDEENMNRIKEIEINSALDQENTFRENLNNNQCVHQKKINLFNFDDEKGNAPIEKKSFILESKRRRKGSIKI